jgi:hypothetical protein
MTSAIVPPGVRSDTVNSFNWDLYRRLQSDDRLNLLCRLSEPWCVSLLERNHASPQDRSNVIPFISRADHLGWRESWKKGRFVRLSWPDAERQAILRQDEILRQADARWAERHGPIPGGARVIPCGRESAPLGGPDRGEELRQRDG